MDSNTKSRIAGLPRYGKYPVPYMFYWHPDGRPDFKVLDYAKVSRCAGLRLCGICGERLGRYVCFVGGPNSSRHGVYHDPPFHRGCVELAFEVCPYLLGQIDHAPEERVKSIPDVVTAPVAPSGEIVGIRTAETYTTWVSASGMGYFIAGPQVGEVEFRSRKHESESTVKTSK